VYVIYYAAFVIGAIFCKKQKFTEGFVFFVMLLVTQILSFLIGRSMDQIQDTYNSSYLTFGELVTIFTYTWQLLEMTAFIILAYGCYRLWRVRSRTEDQSYE